jgi:hypothetical protein
MNISTCSRGWYENINLFNMYISTSWTGWYAHINRIVRAIILASLSPEIFKFRPLLSNSRPEGIFAWNQPAENNRNWGNDDINIIKHSCSFIKQYLIYTGIKYNISVLWSALNILFFLDNLQIKSQFKIMVKHDIYSTSNK